MDSQPHILHTAAPQTSEKLDAGNSTTYTVVPSVHETPKARYGANAQYPLMEETHISH
jgi:hypothetical protein